MSDYLRWNDALAAEFFDPGRAGQPVHLDISEDVISRLAGNLGNHLPGFVEAVKQGPPWATREGLCQRALQTSENWRARERDYPPYIAYLCLFVLAAGLGGEFAPHAYYPRLRRLLGLPNGGILPSFDRMFELWEDLEQWSVLDRDGELGLFKAQIVGEWAHVGYPIAQTVLSEPERRALPAIFTEAAVDPTSTPPAAELARLLRLHEGGRLRARTRNLISNRQDEERYKALLDTVTDELAGWDGAVPEPGTADNLAGTRIFAPLRLCMVRVDFVARRLKATLRCKLNREFPDDQLTLSLPGSRQQFWCEEYMRGWSSSLKDGATGRLVDASRFDWTGRLELRDERLDWKFTLPGRPVRIFVEGSEKHSLPGLVEVYALPRSGLFYLAFEERYHPQLESWAREDCQAFTYYGHLEGLPQSWRLMSATDVKSDTKVRAALPYLSLPATVRLRLAGGIRSATGNNFFAFAPPDCYLEGGDGSEEVWTHEQKLVLGPGTDSYTLPPDLPRESRIPVEARREGKVVARQSLYLTGDFAWQWKVPLQTFDRWGKAADLSGNGQPGVSGAVFAGNLPDTSSFGRPVLFAGGLGDHDTGRVFFVGRSPGEIVRWPAEPLPREWDPVWAVPLARRGRAIYCGGSLGCSDPEPELAGTNRRRVRLWKEVLWRRRRRIAPPGHPAVLRLWTRYQEVARLV